MFRKILFGALTLLLALGLVGCGGNKGGDAGKTDAKTEAVTVEGTPEKAILAYAQLYAYGQVDDANKQSSSLTDADIDKAKKEIAAPIEKAFSQYPLNDESVAAVKMHYVDRLKAAMQMDATVKTEDKEHPVVELKATTINPADAMKAAEANADLTALASAFDELKAQGLTDEQLKESADFQQFALESIDNFIKEYPLANETSVEITCDAVKGSDGKMYWAPKNPAEISAFITGQK